jgi:acyl-CoA thioester hydrolase
MTPARASVGTAFRLPVRVYWEDTDAAGIVYYANYLRFLERTRTEWLRAKGYDQHDLARRHGVVFVVRSVAIEFLKPARLDDELVVSAALREIGAASIELEQRIERAGACLAEGEVKLACVRIAAFQPARIPRELRDAIVG